ncbi:Methyltransferase FkbM [Candidatus Koribacter versatilis Ellin345]|uniref:Methyltransferase FkbM n=1 Tax=Koribacter versatilis (strain Ellin345) TaxID=204669 RepID=Q1IMQ5_KORVE|nr:FkbM family methyltransferase [Candidatus Koribacter versatilis]ABF41845.1 Methyltransferase FkbM [Candidatus Koribacter versatilis Ellin345]
MLGTSMQWLKTRLVKRGPDSKLVQTALRTHARKHGYQVAFADGTIEISKQARTLIVSKSTFVQVPILLECFDLFFDCVEGRSENGSLVLDFSKPAKHRYRKDGAEFYFPSLPEEDVMGAYTEGYTPQPGDVVWDAGAHAGATSYYLAKMVGPTGKVYGFEPDANNYSYLLKNIELHSAQNIIPVKKALSGTTGTARFCMDGTMCAGITDYLVYSEEAKFETVPTITFADACAELGSVPRYVKMDIEGAEVATIESARGFLKEHPIHFAIESYHRVDGEFTYKPLERIFAEIGYRVWSSDKFGQMFTWAAPKE